MKNIISLIIAVLPIFLAVETAVSAVARCTVIDSRGEQMTILCPQKVGAFPNGTKIKIKTDRSRMDQSQQGPAPRPQHLPVKPNNIIKRF